MKVQVTVSLEELADCDLAALIWGSILGLFGLLGQTPVVPPEYITSIFLSLKWNNLEASLALYVVRKWAFW